MISDVLFEAREEIQRYLAEFANVYEEPSLRADLEALCSAMAQLQAELDNPYPFTPRVPIFAEGIKAL